MYLATAKALLGVRVQTPTDLVYIELDIPSVQAMIMKRQMAFLCKYSERDSYEGSPLQVAVDLAKQYKSPMGKYLVELEAMQNDPVTTFKTELCERILHSQSSRCITYRSLNPDLLIHEMYANSSCINEKHRISTTRLRLGSHRLRVETGRWSRTPVEQRLCSCNEDIQTEEHVLTSCSKTQDLRHNFPDLFFGNIAGLMQTKNIMLLCKYCDEVTKIYQ